MIRRLSSAVLIVLLLLIAIPGYGEETHFRDTRWGMTKDEVIEAEGAPPAHESNDFLAYLDKVAGLDVFVGYHFVEDALATGIYTFRETYINPNNHVHDFNKLKRTLSEVYGSPTVDRNAWKNDFYKDVMDEGLAVQAGYLSLIAQWRTDETQITLMLTGENFESDLNLMYSSLALREERDAKMRDEGRRGL